MSTKDQFIDMAQRGILHFQKRLYISCSITRCQVTIFMLPFSCSMRLKWRGLLSTRKSKNNGNIMDIGSSTRVMVCLC